MSKDQNQTVVGFAKIIYSRRSFVALFSIFCLTLIALINHVDTSMSIATVAVGLAASNSYQKKGQVKDE